ncbi:hypothetical protein Dimus_005401, partial [Dionaea muscipula]
HLRQSRPPPEPPPQPRPTSHSTFKQHKNPSFTSEIEEKETNWALTGSDSSVSGKTRAAFVTPQRCRRRHRPDFFSLSLAFTIPANVAVGERASTRRLLRLVAHSCRPVWDGNHYNAEAADGGAKVPP